MMQMKGSANLVLLALVFKISHRACFLQFGKISNPADLEIFISSWSWLLSCLDDLLIVYCVMC